jgi:hypothetical protein
MVDFTPKNAIEVVRHNWQSVEVTMYGLFGHIVVRRHFRDRGPSVDSTTEETERRAERFARRLSDRHNVPVWHFN